jgi:hypothetical protein
MRWSILLGLIGCTGTTSAVDGGAGLAIDAGPTDDGSVDGGLDGGVVDDASPRAERASSIPVGIENVNDSPMKAASHRTLLRFVPSAPMTIDRFYFGFKLRGAACDGPGSGGYGAGDGGQLRGRLVDIDASGRPGGMIAEETVNGCSRWEQARRELGANPVLVWIDLPEVSLQAGRMYGLVVDNPHPDAEANFFSFNMPLADTALAGPHARNELDAQAMGGLLSLDPREHVAWSEDEGQTWAYGSDNGAYRSYMNDQDTDHPATRVPQYGFRTASGEHVAGQPYYAYSSDCVGCTVRYATARYPRVFTVLGGFTASGDDVGILTLSTDGGEQASCVPERGYGFRTCLLPRAVAVAVGDGFTVSSTGSVEVMRLDQQQRLLFGADVVAGQDQPGAGTNALDVPSLWAGPRSPHFPAAGE